VEGVKHLFILANEGGEVLGGEKGGDSVKQGWRVWWVGKEGGRVSAVLNICSVL